MRTLWLPIISSALISLSLSAHATPGACVEGERRPSSDGCNTCECSEGGWTCTELYCEPLAPPTCVEGQAKPAEDGCNSCVCSDGAWACTEVACVSPKPPKAPPLP